MSDEQTPAPDTKPAGPAVPTPLGALLALVFASAMLFNLYWDATHADYSNPTVTIFLGSATLLILGVDVGRILGRR